jgi:cob(I)alamin adenosyltransferase
VRKDSARIAAYGTVDELNSAIGMALTAALETRVAAELRRVQNELFHLGSDLCILEEDKPGMPVPGIEERHVVALETTMDELTAELEPLENFVLPGGAEGAARLHLARTICRRGERELMTLAADEAVGPFTVRYLNRLSDALFVMARYENLKKGVADVTWNSRA